CELTVADQIVTAPNGVAIIGTTNLAATMPQHASQLYSRNVYALLAPWVKDGEIVVDMSDDVAKGACVVANGTVLLGGST
ncbi:MAG: NAD(P)(+) transhydrogenase (Re/Si-specific) subunit alpha, partial [Candidatus Eremiobacteraeota bacterium]|nr:NAD(P)(+) transhydrogenase (Re/Si-specific) subunit alpha [Candidatus Eremiobacteraeota bacterium]